MLDNCCYDCIKVLHDLSRVAWFLKTYCEKDVASCSHRECKDKVAEVKKDLDALIDKVKKEVIS